MDIEPLYLVRAVMFSALIASIATYVIAHWGRGVGSDGFFK